MRDPMRKFVIMWNVVIPFLFLVLLILAHDVFADEPIYARAYFYHIVWCGLLIGFSFFMRSAAKG